MREGKYAEQNQLGVAGRREADYNQAIPPPKRDPDVMLALKQLHNSIDRLLNTVADLNSRLTPVSRCEPTKEPGLVSRGGECQVSAQIIEAQSRIDSIANMVAGQIDLLEI